MGDVSKILADRDPYSLVVDAIWQLLEESADFVELVPPGNRIKFTGTSRDPIKEEVSTADFPEVRVVQTGSTPNPNGCSSMHRDTCRYEVQVASGDQRFDAMHNPLRWVVFKAMAGNSASIRNRVTYHGEKVVASMKPVAVQEGMQADLSRGIKGWSAIWTCEVDLWFPVALVGR